MATNPLAMFHGRKPLSIQNGSNPQSTDKNKSKMNKSNKTRTFSKPVPAQRGNRISKCLNFVQINTNKAKRATDDLVLFSKQFANTFIMVQEPYVNGKNVIPQPTSDLKVLAGNDRATRPRACVYYHKSLISRRATVW